MNEVNSQCRYSMTSYPCSAFETSVRTTSSHRCIEMKHTNLRKVAKIRKRYTQVPHLTQDTTKIVSEHEQEIPQLQTADKSVES